MNSPLLLLISLVVAIQVTMPIGTYLLFNGRTDDKSKLWLFSVSLMSIGISLAALRPFLPAFLSYQITWLLVLGSMQLMVESLKREFDRHTNWRLLAIALALMTVYVTALHFLGLTETVGIITVACLMVFYALWLVLLLQGLHQRYPSKSIRLLQFGMALYGVPQLMRLYAYLMTGNPNSIDVFYFGWATNILIFSFVLAIMFVSLGYWGFTLEKSEYERELAKEGENRASQDAERYKQLVQERDQLLVMNSRFSAISALSSFSAMLVHDIAQPLQAMQLIRDRLRSKLSKGADMNSILTNFDQLEHASERVGGLVLALRQLMQSGESMVTAIQIEPLLQQIDSILNSETLNKKVRIAVSSSLPPEIKVKGDALMLQRIVINLVANALNVFEQDAVKNPTVDIQLKMTELRGRSYVLVQVSDNGPGFPVEFIKRFGQPWSSANPHGLGMALLLSKQLVGLWGGVMEISNASGDAGAVIKLWLAEAA